jgi:hypothetical protein
MLYSALKLLIEVEAAQHPASSLSLHFHFQGRPAPGSAAKTVLSSTEKIAHVRQGDVRYPGFSLWRVVVLNRSCRLSKQVECSLRKKQFTVKEF